MLAAVSSAAAVLAPFVSGGGQAYAATATAWVGNKTLPGGGQGFDNYDYGTKSRSANNVDWAVNLLFTNNATVNKTSDGWSAANPNWVRGSTAYAWVNGVWDSNKGLKQYSNGSCNRKATNYHYRVYAAPTTDTLVSVNYGYFVIGTAHDDYAENCGPAYALTGHEEAAESYVGGIFRNRGYTVRFNAINLSNAQSGSCESVGGIPHCWDNNGKATQIEIP